MFNCKIFTGHVIRNSPFLAKLFMCLEQVIWTWSTVNILQLNMLLVLYGFISWLFKTNSCFTSWLLHFALFSSIRLDVTSYLPGITDRTPEALSLHTGHGRNACGLQLFLLLTVFLSVNFWWCFVVFYKNKKIVIPQENVWSIGFYSQSFLTHDNW